MRSKARSLDRFALIDVMAEATAELSARPMRLIATALGTVLGVGALVATIGFAQTSDAQIAQQFAAVAGRQAVVSPATEPGPDGRDVPVTRLDWNAASQISRISGVQDAALLSKLSLGSAVVSAVTVDDPSAPILEQPRLYAGSPQVVRTAGATMVSGRMFDTGHDRRGARVAVVSARAATRLGVGDVGSQPSVFLGGMAYAVIGIYDDAKYDGDLQDAIIIPSNTARDDFNLASPDEVLVRLAVNSGPILTTQGPIALSPGDPEQITVAAPSGVSTLQKNVQGDVSLVFIILSVVVLLAGGFGIANVTMLSVMERTAEIGLRRAVGATARQIAAQFMAESMIVGVLGGLIGSAAGVVFIEVFAVSHAWTAVISTGVALGGVVVGALVGLLAGTLPARRAARIEPVDALRG
ncbi:MAG TPA: ABC transporter permease [Lacisediminihabitans sp.]|nr:ABC transporter permease [Lacisediminihabitans sp.]HXD62312.1 ABC transporter permease [Lacisediminihabitans sp.]